jgi:hypothetical protein
VQGIVNLSQAGPDDGGLMVLKGSAPLFDRFFEENPVKGPTPWRTAKHKDFHPFSEANVDWYKAQGCEPVKVCAEPGDLIMWDSRQVHVRDISDFFRFIYKTQMWHVLVHTRTSLSSKTLQCLTPTSPFEISD